VPVNERLLERIQELMADKSETYYVESTAPRNPHIDDLNALPFACKEPLDDADPDHVPSVVYGPDLEPWCPPHTML
jgi:hypothetical protein